MQALRMTLAAPSMLHRAHLAGFPRISWRWWSGKSAGKERFRMVMEGLEGVNYYEAMKDYQPTRCMILMIALIIVWGVEEICQISDLISEMLESTKW
jgi:hypothetical protein